MMLVSVGWKSAANTDSLEHCRGHSGRKSRRKHMREEERRRKTNTITPAQCAGGYLIALVTGTRRQSL